MNLLVVVDGKAKINVSDEYIQNLKDFKNDITPKFDIEKLKQAVSSVEL